jgi:succinate-semialdehyde dehydrogenase/glutarate-semialdehyde dehydrogenase
MQNPGTGNASASINPATGEALAHWPYADPPQIERCIEAAASAAAAWRRVPPQERGVMLRATAAGLRARKAELARLVTLEMGKPITEAEAEVEKSAWNCGYVAEQGPGWLADDVVPTQARSSYVSHLPLGVVLSILPWNFPVWQVFRCAAGALMAGNSLLLKHAPNVQGCAELITRIIAEAGAPAGLFQNLHAPVEAIAGIIADRRVAAVTLTGSPAAGGKVAAQAGAACKKSVLELGGSDAFIVLADADLPAAVAAAVRARFTNCGQVCLAAKRFFIEARIAEEFTARFTAAATALRSGDPLHSTVTPDMPVVAQETFGPVAALHAQGRLTDPHRHALPVLAAGADAGMLELSSFRSLPTIDRHLGQPTSGPLPIRVAPLTGRVTRPFSIR